MLVFQHQPKASEGELIQPNNGYSIAAHRLMNKLILFIRHPLHMQRLLVKILHWTVSLGNSANDLPFHFQFEVQTGPLPNLNFEATHIMNCLPQRVHFDQNEHRCSENVARSRKTAGDSPVKLGELPIVC